MDDYVFAWAGFEGPCVYRSDAAGLLAFMAGFCGWEDKSMPQREVLRVSWLEYRA